MKRLLTLLIAIITLVSCDELINSIAPNDYINVEPTNELHFLSSESSIVLTVDSSGKWMVEGITEWCSVTPESGVNGDELTISVTENTLDKARTAELTLRCGVAEIIISVVQEKMVETDYVDMYFDSEGTATQYNASTGIVSITYSNGNIPNVAVGKAIVLPADYKFDIRVVESVSKSDNTLTLETSQGSMCNLFRNTSFTLSINENTRSVDANGRPITPVAIGYYDVNGKYIETYNQLKPSTLSTHTISTALWSFNMGWNGATLSEGKGGRLWWEKCAFDAGLNGIFNFDFGEQIGGVLGKLGELEEFSYTLQGSIGADLLMRYYYENSATFNDDRILEYNVIPTKVYKFVVNGVYVYILVNTHLGQYVEFGAEGSVDVSGGVKLGLDVEAGLKWSKAHGVEVIKSATPHMDIYHPTIRVEASAYAKFSYYPQIEIGLYNYIGPYFEPRSYVKEMVSAGFRTSTDGENYVAFKDEFFCGLDMHMGLKLGFGFLDQEWKSDVFNVVEDTLLSTSPSRITQTSPSSGRVTIEEGESVNATFKVESYSPVIGKYWACEGATVVFESESGKLSNSFTITDASGIACVIWTPTESTRTTTKEYTLKARIYDTNGVIIDEELLIAEVKKDEKHPNAVDLGLSCKWASCNVGARTPEKTGSLFAWGPTCEEDPEYDEYIEDISSTPWDAAKTEWGAGWRMPTRTELEELCRLCDWQVANGGYKIIGPSGNSIFLPVGREAGYKEYWSSTAVSHSNKEELHAVGFPVFFLQTGGERGYVWNDYSKLGEFGFDIGEGLSISSRYGQRYLIRPVSE